MSAYNLLGAINSLFIFISVLGVYSQLRKIWGRKRTLKAGDATAILSLN